MEKYVAKRVQFQQHRMGKAECDALQIFGAIND
jgi:hypothetical protein